jgi:hypothetical protein
MNSHANADFQRATFPLTAAELVRSVGISATALLLFTAVFVLWRRLAGALGSPLPAGEMLLAGVLLAALAGIARLPTMTLRPFNRNALVTASVIVLGVSLSFLRGNAAGLIGFWALIAAEEAFAWRHALRFRIGRAGGRWTSPPATARSGSSSALLEEQEPTEPAADVLQQLTLRTTAAGAQEVSGWLRMPLVPGQRTANLHVAFCPPLASVPEVQAEAVSGPGCRIKLAQAMCYGVRLEVKLDSPAAAGDNVLVWFFAAAKLTRLDSTTKAP